MVSVSVSVETRRSDDLYTGASPDGDGVEAERWPLLGGDGGRREMGRGRLEVLVDNAWRTHVGRRGGEGCYDAYRSVLYRDPRASPCTQYHLNSKSSYSGPTYGNCRAQNAAP